ncbi:MAG: UxaA family hydrolase [Chloroflexi bacterium]|nr:UxaA family hydrolase [Chloroflexota bacterium]
MNSNALKVNPRDNVAIAIRQIVKGEDIVVDGVKLLQAAEDVPPSHKIALVDIKAGGVVIRYGEPIVQAKDDIRRGQWVHVHNSQPIERD